MILESDEDLEVVEEATDRVEALAIVDSLKPDVFQMDIQMPVMDGIEATKRVREGNPSDHGSRVLILTTFGQAGRVSFAFDAGASGILLKRMHADELIAGIKDAALPSVAPIG